MSSPLRSTTGLQSRLEAASASALADACARSPRRCAGARALRRQAECAFEAALGLRADGLGLRLAILEQNQVRDREDAVSLCELLLLVQDLLIEHRLVHCLPHGRA